MEDDRPLDAEPHQNVGHLARERGVGHAEGLVARACRIAQGTQHVEHRPDSQLTAGDRGEPE